MKERRDSILSNPFWSTNVLVDEEPIDVDVVVIGAGCAGLECAQQLYNNGKLVDTLIVVCCLSGDFNFIIEYRIREGCGSGGSRLHWRSHEDHSA